MRVVAVEESTAAVDAICRSLLRGLAQTADAGLLVDDTARAAAQGVAIAVLQDALMAVPDHERWGLMVERVALLRAFVAELDS